MAIIPTIERAYKEILGYFDKRICDFNKAFALYKQCLRVRRSLAISDKKYGL